MMKEIDPVLKEYLVKYGSSSFAYSSIQPAAKQFIVPDAGYIAYMEHKGRIFALGEPIVNPDAKEDLLFQFIRDYSNPCFLQVNRDTADVLTQFGYLSSQLGIETSLPFPPEGSASEFYSSGKNRRQIRKTAKKYSGDNITTEILSMSELQSDKGISIDSLISISDEWMSGKEGNQELEGLARPYVNDDEEDVVKLFVFQDNKLLGYAVFDPIYRDQTVTGYSANMFRFVPDAPKGRTYHSVLWMMDYLQDKDNLVTNTGRPIRAEAIELGLSPLYRPNPPNSLEFIKHDSTSSGDLKTSKVLDFLFTQAFSRNLGYSFQGLAEHKRQYRGLEIPTYYASHKNKNRVMELVRAFQANKVLPNNNNSILLQASTTDQSI